MLCAYDCYVSIMWFDSTCIHRAGRPLGAYNLEVATPRALVYAGVMTSGDARSWYMISEDAKSWVFECFRIYSLSYCTLVHCLKVLAHRLGFLQTYELTNIIVDLFEYHFQVCFDKGDDGDECTCSARLDHVFGRFITHDMGLDFFSRMRWGHGIVSDNMECNIRGIAK
nr:hypothetical protein [Tanacetum cinerariifolium]